VKSSCKPPTSGPRRRSSKVNRPVVLLLPGIRNLTEQEENALRTGMRKAQAANAIGLFDRVDAVIKAAQALAGPDSVAGARLRALIVALAPSHGATYGICPIPPDAKGVLVPDHWYVFRLPTPEDGPDVFACVLVMSREAFQFIASWLREREKVLTPRSV
jgi:hypothetical protein